MKHGRPSRTAYMVAMRRAAHQLLDRPRVLDDPVALPIVGGPAAEAKIRSEMRRHHSALGRSLRAFIVARSRRAEDALAEAVANGVRQYVVLGAGLDTFAYRNLHADAGLRVFEVDHPSTQAWKRERLARGGIVVPSSVTYVPVDFETQALAERLRESGFRAEAPAWFSWLGVTMYLTRDAAMETLAYVAGLPAGSGVTFDYFVPLGSLPLIRRLAIQWFSLRLHLVGEPWRTSFDPGALARELRALGFTRLEDLDSEALAARYFGDGAVRIGGRSVGRVMTALK